MQAGRTPYEAEARRIVLLHVDLRRARRVDDLLAVPPDAGVDRQVLERPAVLQIRRRDVVLWRGHERGHWRVGDGGVRSGPVEVAVDRLAGIYGIGEDVDLLAAGH